MSETSPISDADKKPKVVADATSLIYLQQCGGLGNALKAADICTTDYIIEEELDGTIIESRTHNFNSEPVPVHEATTDDLRVVGKIDDGEKTAIELAKEEEYDYFYSDDEDAANTVEISPVMAHLEAVLQTPQMLYAFADHDDIEWDLDRAKGEARDLFYEEICNHVPKVEANMYKESFKETFKESILRRC